MSTLFTRGVALALLALSLTGCANLGPIQEFGKLSADGAAYTRLSDEYIASHEVRKRYTFEADSAQRDVLSRQSAERQPQRAQLQVFHRAVTDYMHALADLAADDLTRYDAEVDGLVDAAAGSNYIAPDQAGAVKAVTRLLADAASNGYRQKELKQVIERANGPLQIVLGAMTRVMAAFDSSIQDERAAYTRYQRTMLAMARENNREPVAAQLVWTESNLVFHQYDERSKAIPAYVATLANIAAAHQALYDNRDNIGDKEVLAQLKRQTRSIRSALRLARAGADPT